MRIDQSSEPGLSLPRSVEAASLVVLWSLKEPCSFISGENAILKLAMPHVSVYLVDWIDDGYWRSAMLCEVLKIILVHLYDIVGKACKPGP